jgi:hypothetical protein
MSNAEANVSPLFLQLVLSLQSAAWYQLGKMVSPVSGKIERDLEQAKVSIDLLAMLQEKTKDNLLDEEKRILDTTVYNLQMNYVEELEKDKTEKKEEKPESEGQQDTKEQSETKEQTKDEKPPESTENTDDDSQSEGQKTDFSSHKEAENP